MRQKPGTKQSHGEKVVKGIRRANRKQYSAEEKIRIVLDGKVEEPLANVQAALISKTTDWEHEREWRIYVKEDRVDKIVGHPADPIHLLDFPPDAVNRVILGPKTRPEIANRIRDAVADRYPHAPVMRAVPNRRSHTYDEVSE